MLLQESEVATRERLHLSEYVNERTRHVRLAPPNRPIFIAIETSAFSGATLLSFLLNAHPQIASIGEMDGLLRKNPNEYVCSCGTPIRRCEFWQAMRHEMAQHGCEFDVANFAMKFLFDGPRWMQRLRSDSFHSQFLDAIREMAIRSLPGESQRFQQRVARNRAFVESVLKLTGKKIFVDTSKDRLRARALKMFSTYDVRVIHLVRDPRGVIASRLRRHSDIPVSQAAREWVDLHIKLQDYAHLLNPAKFMGLRYEDLCRDPRALLQKLYRFCGALPSFEPSEFKSTAHHIVGNPMRLKSVSVIKLDESWREQLPIEQQKEIWQIAGNLSVQYGYSPE